MGPDLRFWSGAERTRTADPLLAKQVLYQLSYRPSILRRRSDLPARDHAILAPELSCGLRRGGAVLERRPTPECG